MTSGLNLHTDQQYIDFLTREFGWQIKGPSYATAPQPQQKYIQNSQREVELIQHYLTQTYIIQDQFDVNHRARRAFLNQIRSTHPEINRWFESHSKLKKNKIDANILMPIFIIVEHLQDSFPELYERLQNWTFELYRDMAGDDKRHGYDKMAFDEKVAFVQKVDTVAYGFLEELVR